MLASATCLAAELEQIQFLLGDASDANHRTIHWLQTEPQRKRYSRGGLYKLLKNQVYIGKIGHRGETYDGQHSAIISAETWEKVSAQLQANNQGQRRPGRTLARSPLAGLVFDTKGNRYTPTYAVKGGRRYRYYTSQAVIHKRTSLDRIPAGELEQLVSSRIQKFLASPDELATVFAESGFAETDIRQVIEAAQDLAANWSKLTSAETSEILSRSLVKIVTNGSAVQIQVDLRALSECIEKEDSGCSVAREGQPRAAAHLTTLTVPLTVARHRGELRLVLPGPDKLYGNSNSSLLKALVRALQWKRRVVGSEIYSKQQLAREANLNASYVGRILKLAALSPECIGAVVQHGKTFDQQLSEILGTISLDWDKQKRLLRQIRTDH